MVYRWVLWWFNGLYCSTGDIMGRSLNVMDMNGIINGIYMCQQYDNM